MPVVKKINKANQEKLARFPFKFNIDNPHAIHSVHFAGVPWMFTTKWIEHEGNTCLGIDVECNKHSISNLWSCDSEILFKVFRTEGAPFYGEQMKCIFTKDRKQYCNTLLLKKEEILNAQNHYSVQNEISIEVTVNVRESIGIRNENVSDFRESDYSESEVGLIVEGRKLVLDKHLLITFSPYFRHLLPKDSKIGTITIDDVGYEEMKCFLNVLNQATQPINADNVESILKLAARFEVNFIRNKCEEVLITSSMSPHQKLEFAEKYNFSLLQSRTLESFNSINQIQGTFSSASSRLSEKTARVLLDRIFDLNTTCNQHLSFRGGYSSERFLPY